MWKILQKNTPSDYVISTGKQYTVKQFVNLVLNKLNIKYYWKGKILNPSVTIKIMKLLLNVIKNILGL